MQTMLQNPSFLPFMFSLSVKQAKQLGSTPQISQNASRMPKMVEKSEAGLSAAKFRVANMIACFVSM